MDEEIDRWRDQWREIEVDPIDLTAKGRSLIRGESAGWTFTVIMGLIAVPGVAIVTWSVVRELERRGDVSPSLVILNAVSWLGLIALSLGFWRWLSQVKQERQRLTGTSIDLVTGLIAIRKRQLYWNAAKTVWVPTVLFFLVLSAASASMGLEQTNAGRDALVYWACAAVFVATPVLTGSFVLFRVRFLRRELAALGELRDELTP